MSLDIVLGREDRCYRPGDVVSGTIVVTTKGGMSHSGLVVQVVGRVTLQLSAKTVGLFEAFYNSLKPVTVIDYTLEIQKSGKFNDGTTELPFEFRLEPLAGQQLYETYHGVYVNVQYTIQADLTRPFLGKNLQKLVEFIVETPSGEKIKPAAEKFLITPESLDAIKKAAAAKGVPNFRLRGQLDNTSCIMNQPFAGSIIVEECEQTIKSIELQLVRVETCGCAEGYAKEATEIQNIQIADGDVARGMEIPIFMIFPRLFTCPSIATRTFKVDFEVNLVVMFSDGRHITEKFPIKLVRP
eukprot:TRINITY_DN953_c0_g1_i2.p1 TRINITY_DN953_c0_g1~~TRINITY_DN953_c0_g1_i2.p1  ORF type:complete len:298 (-),score=56.73 TRINITY_DN953_c0_g1_i2:229-1122(-)